MRILLTESQIHKCVTSVAKRLNKLASENKDKEIVLVGILKEAFIFISDLSRNLNFDYTLEFVDPIYYPTRSPGRSYFVSEIKPELIHKVTNKIVIVIDLLTGDKTNYITKLMNNYSYIVYQCTLFGKENFESCENEHLNYIGYDKLPDVNFVGYGFGNRNSPGIYTEEDLTKENYIQLVQKLQREVRML